jgi:hypothetical protein
VKVLEDSVWRDRGFTLLWGADALAGMKVEEAISLRQLFALRQEWPEELPSREGDAVVVAGLDASLDCLSPADAASWLQEDVAQLLLDFQSRYESQAALIFWLPGGRARVRGEASGHYHWECAGQHGAQSLPIGRLLWSGAELEARRIVQGQDANPDGASWIGLYLPRIS